MHDYSGSDSWPPNLSLIDDSDSPTAVNFNPGHEGNADRTVWLRNRLRNVTMAEYTSSTGSVSVVVAAGVTWWDCEGWGAGGGGGGGRTLTGTGAGIIVPGGGGGGGALRARKLVAVTPGETLTVTIGAGGSAANQDADGGDGASTTIKRAGVTIAEWKGAQGGAGAQVGGTTALVSWSFGGAPVAGMRMVAATRYGSALAASFVNLYGSFFHDDTPSHGGSGVGGLNNYLQAGNANSDYAGGASGAYGVDNTNSGGGPGGGGGAGPGGPGGGGGNGGDAAASGAGDVGGSGGGGAVSAFNTGAGGGGGGGAGGGTSGSPRGGFSGPGDSGFLRVVSVEVGTL